MTDEDRWQQSISVPSWNSDPTEWERYRDEVRVYCLSTKVTVEYSLAARLVQRLRGAARRVGLQMTDVELSADPGLVGLDGREMPPAREQVLAGVTRLMARLESLAPAVATRRGGYMRSFFSQHERRRRIGERIPAWIVRWEEGLEKLRRDQIDIDALGDLAGWWFLEVDANLTEERIEMVKTHVDPESMYDRFELRTALLRLFPNLHLTEARRANLQRVIPSRPSWQRQRDDRWTAHGATGSRGGGKGGDARRSYGKGRQINTIEDEEGSLGSEESEYDDDGGYDQVAGVISPTFR